MHHDQAVVYQVANKDPCDPERYADKGRHLSDRSRAAAQLADGPALRARDQRHLLTLDGGENQCLQREHLPGASPAAGDCVRANEGARLSGA